MEGKVELLKLPLWKVTRERNTYVTATLNMQMHFKSSSPVIADCSLGTFFWRALRRGVVCISWPQMEFSDGTIWWRHLHKKTKYTVE